MYYYYCLTNNESLTRYTYTVLEKLQQGYVNLLLVQCDTLINGITKSYSVADNFTVERAHKQDSVYTLCKEDGKLIPLIKTHTCSGSIADSSVLLDRKP